MLKITKNQGSIQVTADKSGFYPFDGTITFPTNSLFTATSANTDMITFKSTSNGDVQFVGNYKDITISGRSYDTKQKFLTAFSNLANQGSVDAYTKAETDTKLDAKQGKLKAGNGITLTEDATDNTTVVKTAVSLTDNGNGAYTVGDSITIDSKSSVKIGKNWTQEIEDMTDRVTTIAIGYDAETNDTYGKGDIAIGDRAQSFSTGIGSIAIGKNTLALGDHGHSSIAIGSGAKVTNNYANGIVIGLDAKVNDGSDSIVIGNNARTESSFDSVAIGHVAFSKQSNGIAIGRGAGAEANDKVTNGDSIAIGHFARADGADSIALGYYSKGQKGGVAIGTCSTAKAEKGIAIGNNAMASVENGVAIGELAQTAADKPLVISAGNKTVDGYKTPITMIQGDANGKISIIKGDGTDERMVIQDEIEALKNAGGSGGTVDGLVIDVNKVTAGLEQSLGLVQSDLVVIGNKAKAYNPSSVVIGQEANGGGRGSTTIGSTAECTSGDETITVGYSATTDGDSNVAIGTSSKIKGSGNIGIGWMAECTSGYSNAIGYRAKSSARYGLSIGYEAKTDDTTPLVIKAGKDSNYNPLTVLQSDANGKLSILKGDGTDERIVIQDALSAGGSGGGTVDAYTKAETDTKLDAKQDKLTAGTGITIDENNVISSTGGSGGSANPYVNVKGVNGSATIADDVAIGIAIGERTSVTKGEAIAIGNQSQAKGRYCVSVGRLSTCMGDSTVAVGDNAKSMMPNAVAVGSSTQSLSKNSVAIGSGAHADNKIPLVINAGEGQNSRPLTMIQGDTNGKISILLGDGTTSTMCLQDEIAALKAEIAALKGGASTGA